MLKTIYQVVSANCIFKRTYLVEASSEDEAKSLVLEDVKDKGLDDYKTWALEADGAYTEGTWGYQITSIITEEIKFDIPKYYEGGLRLVGLSENNCK